jgi:hypothetical protein
VYKLNAGSLGSSASGYANGFTLGREFLFGFQKKF